MGVQVSLAGELIRTVIALGLVIGVIWLLGWFVRRRSTKTAHLGPWGPGSVPGAMGRGFSKQGRSPWSASRLAGLLAGPSLAGLPGGKAANTTVGSGARSPVEILSRQVVSRGFELVLVSFGPSRVLLLGIGPTGISLLGEEDSDAVLSRADSDDDLDGVQVSEIEEDLSAQRLKDTVIPASRIERLRELTVRRS